MLNGAVFAIEIGRTIGRKPRGEICLERGVAVTKTRITPQCIALAHAIREALAGDPSQG